MRLSGEFRSHEINCPDTGYGRSFFISYSTTLQNIATILLKHCCSILQCFCYFVLYEMFVRQIYQILQLKKKKNSIGSANSCQWYTFFRSKLVFKLKKFTDLLITKLDWVIYLNKIAAKLLYISIFVCFLLKSENVCNRLIFLCNRLRNIYKNIVCCIGILIK